MQANTLERPPLGGSDAGDDGGHKPGRHPGDQAPDWAHKMGERANEAAEPGNDWALLDVYSRTVAWVAEQLLPSVGALRVEDHLRRPFASGSAVVISADGLAVTSAHVVSS